MNSYRIEVQEKQLQMDSSDNFLFFTLFFGKESTPSERYRLLRFFREQKISVFYNRKSFVATMSGRYRKENNEYCITLGCKLIN